MKRNIMQIVDKAVVGAWRLNLLSVVVLTS